MTGASFDALLYKQQKYRLWANFKWLYMICINPLKYAPLVLRLNYTSELGDNFEYKICENSNAIHDLCVYNTENAHKSPSLSAISIQQGRPILWLLLRDTVPILRGLIFPPRPPFHLLIRWKHYWIFCWSEIKLSKLFVASQWNDLICFVSFSQSSIDFYSQISILWTRMRKVQKKL